MADQERKDIQTRFKKGQSGNPRGRPRGRKNNAGLLSDAFFTTVRIKDAAGIRSVPKIVAAAEVCLNNALKGDLRSFAKAMEIAEKFGVLKPESIQQEITHANHCRSERSGQGQREIARSVGVMSVLSSIVDIHKNSVTCPLRAMNGLTLTWLLWE
jgi:hypothetical protein